MRIGIIPAAGKSQRFGGVLKELLPAKDGVPFMIHAINHVRPICDLIVVVTNKDKIQTHANNIRDVFFVEQNNNLDILGAIQTAMGIHADRYYLVMPDTFVSDNAFYGCSHLDDLGLGVFITHKPNRFGYIVDSTIKDKANDMPLPAQAWGVLSWSDKYRPLFFSKSNLAYTLTAAMQSGYSTWNIGHYFDIADIYEYVDYLKS